MSDTTELKISNMYQDDFNKMLDGFITEYREYIKEKPLELHIPFGEIDNEVSDTIPNADWINMVLAGIANDRDYHEVVSAAKTAIMNQIYEQLSVLAPNMTIYQDRPSIMQEGKLWYICTKYDGDYKILKSFTTKAEAMSFVERYNLKEADTLEQCLHKIIEVLRETLSYPIIMVETDRTNFHVTFDYENTYDNTVAIRIHWDNWNLLTVSIIKQQVYTVGEFNFEKFTWEIGNA